MTPRTTDSTAEYQAVRAFYGDRRAKRTGLPYINHINEALLILEWRNAPEVARRAYCLHPLFQGDDALVQTAQSDLAQFDPLALVLAVEYRAIANSHLSRDDPAMGARIKLSPLAAVNEMLVADKIQNRKDFELHFQGDAARTAELRAYFSNWLSRLGIEETVYEQFKVRLMATG